jgi:hypothetical protein
MRKQQCWIFLCILFPYFVSAQNIVINEVMASNQKTIFDDDGDASDWIEVYNPGSDPVNLSGYGLSDDPLDSLKWRFGSTILASGGHLVIFASNKNRYTANLHTNFKISASGETVVLTDSSGVVIDRVEIPVSSTDISYARTTDGGLTWIFQHPTPGSKNTGDKIEGWADSVSVSLPGGFYSTQINITLSAGDSKIFYTVDGSVPDSSKTEYTAPIILTKTTVLKAMSGKDNYLPTHPITRTYFINESTNLPVISLSADPYDLFDADSGIYTNYKMDWERPAHIEFFEDDKSPGFSEDCGVNISGSQSAEWTQKSFAVKFKRDYGASKIEYPLFPDFRVTTFHSFVLRNSGNDFQYTHIRDAMMQTLVKNLDIDYLEYRPATAFINGQYWGIYNIREKVNEYYVASRLGVNPKNIDMLENNMVVLHGDSLHYRQLIDYISSNDMSTSTAYDYVNSMVDLDECILYFAAQAYYDNMDWPGTNCKFWRERSPQGKWRWILFDLDFGFGLYAHGAWEDHIKFMFSTVETRYSNPPWATLLQRKLVENPTIRNRFINQIADLLNTNFKSARVLEVINTLANHIASEITKHRTRWGITGENLTKMTTFAQDRPAYLRTHVRNYFNCGDDATITIDASDGGSVLLNTLTLQFKDLPFSGVYFQGIPIHLKAVPAPGYKFDGWIGAASSQHDTLSLSISKTSSITAIFSIDSTDTKGIVINEINYNSSDQFNSGDWIEFHNRNKQSIDISGWIFRDSEADHSFTFPAGTIVGSDQYLVLVEDSSLFRSCFPDVKNFIGEMNFGLSGSGELIRLLDEEGQGIDSLTYDDQAPWPRQADGQGATLELTDPFSDNALGENWKVSVGYGSPGRKNSVLAALDEMTNETIPDKFQLLQNYPNPFNPTTMIRYQLITPCLVTLKVFDMLGREVATLVNEVSNSGDYEIGFNASGLATGIYFYQLHAGENIDIKKMILLR